MPRGSVNDPPADILLVLVGNGDVEKGQHETRVSLRENLGDGSETSWPNAAEGGLNTLVGSLLIFEVSGGDIGLVFPQMSKHRLRLNRKTLSYAPGCFLKMVMMRGRTPPKRSVNI